MGGAKNAVWNAASSIEIVDRRTSDPDGGGGGEKIKYSSVLYSSLLQLFLSLIRFRSKKKKKNQREGSFFSTGETVGKLVRLNN